MDLTNDEVKYIERNGVEFLEFAAFDGYRDKITAVFGIRGKNVADYALNTQSDDLDKICNELGIDKEKSAYRIRQVHGDKSLAVSGDVDEEADAVMTDVCGCALMIRVADCIAVMIYDPVKNVVANIHSGWRGTLQRIAPKAVLKMQEAYGSRPEDLVVVLCPSIGADHFEVMDDVRVQFAAEFDDSHIDDCGDGHYLIDAEAYLADSLSEVGVQMTRIHRSGLCTVCHRNMIHSYRGNDEDEKKLRNVAIICLK